jgi:hypothetical protein
MRDLANHLDFLQAFPPKAAVTDGTAQVSAIFDRRGFDGAMLAYTVGTLTDADAVWSCLIEDSDDGSTFAAVADEYLTGTEVLAGFTFGDDNECRKIGYTGIKRYLRATIDDTTANTGNLFVSGMWIGGYPSRMPTPNPPALVAFT